MINFKKYRKLRKNETVCKGDKWTWHESDSERHLELCKGSIGRKAGLFEEPIYRPIKPRKKVKGWINIYPDRGIGTVLHCSKESADTWDKTYHRSINGGKDYRIACIPIEFVEGEGLEKEL